MRSVCAPTRGQRACSARTSRRPPHTRSRRADGRRRTRVSPPTARAQSQGAQAAAVCARRRRARTRERESARQVAAARSVESAREGRDAVEASEAPVGLREERAERDASRRRPAQVGGARAREAEQHERHVRQQQRDDRELREVLAAAADLARRRQQAVPQVRRPAAARRARRARGLRDGGGAATVEELLARRVHDDGVCERSREQYFWAGIGDVHDGPAAGPRQKRSSCFNAESNAARRTERVINDARHPAPVTLLEAPVAAERLSDPD
eukprot:1110735-Prymnesium_polylepis.1